MEVVVARLSGFCWGVERAFETVDAAVKHANGRPVVTLGPIIHNPGVIASLAKRGVTLADPDAIPNPGTTAVVRAHGLPKPKRRALEALGENIFDATCPFVFRVQRAVASAGATGRFALLVGDANHAEFRAAQTYAEGPIAVVASADDVAALPYIDVGVTVIAQTTLDRATFEAVVDATRARFSDVIAEDTRCDDTRARQAEAEELACDADVVIVVGGKNSANTGRLASIAERRGAKTHLVETTADVDPMWFCSAMRVAILGGASTPRADVEAVAAGVLGVYAKPT